MACSVADEVKNAVLGKVQEESPRPTELLLMLRDSFSYGEIQDALGALLESGEVELDKDRRLRAKLAEAS